MSEDPREEHSFSADDIKAADVTRRSFLSRLGKVGMVAPAAPLLAACGGSDDCDSDTGDPVVGDSDITQSDQDPNDPVVNGDPPQSGTDTDVGDDCDSD